MTSRKQLSFDKLAISLSGLCAIHCLSVPIVLALFPSLLTLQLDHHLFHQTLVWFVVPISVFAITLGCKQHKDKYVLTLAVVGLIALVTTAVYGHELLGENGEKIATLISVTIIAIAHWRNYSICSNGQCDHE